MRKSQQESEVNKGGGGGSEKQHDGEVNSVDVNGCQSRFPGSAIHIQQQQQQALHIDTSVQKVNSVCVRVDVLTRCCAELPLNIEEL